MYIDTIISALATTGLLFGVALMSVLAVGPVVIDAMTRRAEPGPAATGSTHAAAGHDTTFVRAA